MDIPDAYPVDDSETDALHPHEQADAESADAIRQRDYEDLVRMFLAPPTNEPVTLAILRDALDGRLNDLYAYAVKYGWKQALHVVYGVLPSAQGTHV